MNKRTSVQRPVFRPKYDCENLYNTLGKGFTIRQDFWKKELMPSSTVRKRHFSRLPSLRLSVREPLHLNPNTVVNRLIVVTTRLYLGRGLSDLKNRRGIVGRGTTIICQSHFILVQVQVFFWSGVVVVFELLLIMVQHEPRKQLITTFHQKE